MPDTPKQTKDALNAADWKAIAEFIKDEKERRKEARHHKEQQWAEVDRQLRMEPKPRVIVSGDKNDWFPNIELPLQFDTLEVTAADVKRLAFPRGTEWYDVNAELSDEYIERFEKRRETKPLIGSQPIPAKLDQETANTLVKTAIDHYHRLFDFRANVISFAIEAIKYGSAVVRVREVNHPDLSNDYRGVKGDVRGPAMIPCSIKNTYLDDSPHSVMHEGISSAPSTIRTSFQHLEKLTKAARMGGSKRGWMIGQIKELEPLGDQDAKKGHVELLEWEGDLIVPRKRGESIFLPNVLVTVAVGNNAPRPVRFRENPVPFHSYAIGHYMRENLQDVYGTSPLIKGLGLQEAASLVFNSLMAAGALNAEPPVAYDVQDTQFAGDSGPDIHPNALWPSDAPDKIIPQKIGNIDALLNVYIALLKQYEDLTGNTEARRGDRARSHTSATGADIEAAQGIVRVQDFVNDLELGPLTSILYMEYAIIKDVMKRPQPVSVGSGGIEGWINLAAADLPDRSIFLVQGSSGQLNERQRIADFDGANEFALKVQAQAAQLDVEINLNYEEQILERYRIAGINNAQKFIGGNAALPAGTTEQSTVSPDGQGNGGNETAPIQAQ